MAPTKRYMVIILLVLKLDISICQNASNESFTLDQNLNEIVTSESTLHVCTENLIIGEDFFTSCDKDIPGGRNITSDKCWIAPPHLMSTSRYYKFPLTVRDLPGACQLNTTTAQLSVQPNDNEKGLGKFIHNGYLEFENEFYHMEEFCIANISENSMEIKICKPKCDEERTCIRKCCGIDKVYSFGFSPNPFSKPNLNKGCVVPEKGSFRPTLYHDSRRALSEDEIRDSPGIHYSENYPNSFRYFCPKNRTLFFSSPYVIDNINNITGRVGFSSLRFRIRKDGKILFRGPGGQCEILDPNRHHFCVEGAVNFEPEGLDYHNSEESMVLFLCAVTPVEQLDTSLVYGCMMMFSCVFLALTVIVYGMLWERQTVHGWTIVTHTVCLYFMYVFVGTGHFIRYFQGANMHHATGCIFVGVAAHFFTLATFSWLAVISFDLFLTFRAITPRSGNRSKGWSRYLKYSIFGWGIPIIIIITGLVIDSKHTDDDCMETLSPAYGFQSCYIQERAMGLYLYLPLGIFLFCNLLFFGITTTKLYQFRESTKMATKDDTQQQFYRLFVKLFFVMGILWIFEVISWAISGVGMTWYWVIFDTINILRAVAVFFIFVCKPDIIKALEQKYPRLRPLFVPCKRILFRKGMHHSQKNHTTDESIGLNSSSMRTKSSSLRAEMEH